MYKKVLLKLSGEALGDATSPYNFEFLDYLAKQIKALRKKGVQVGIVVGGGNICRGKTFEKLGMDREKSDYVGMQATNLNAQVLGQSLTNNGVLNKVLTTYPVKGVLDYSVKRANSYIKKGYVVVFGGGTGKPFFSTDTACALRAKDIGSEVILFAKNGVDGVYDSDPKTNPNAKRYEELYFNDIIKENLQVIDIAAAKICKKEHINGFVFDIAQKDSIKKSVDLKVTGTVIK